MCPSIRSLVWAHRNRPRPTPSSSLTTISIYGPLNGAIWRARVRRHGRRRCGGGDRADQLRMPGRSRRDGSQDAGDWWQRDRTRSLRCATCPAPALGDSLLKLRSLHVGFRIALADGNLRISAVTHHHGFDPSTEREGTRGCSALTEAAEGCGRRERTAVRAMKQTDNVINPTTKITSADIFGSSGNSTCKMASASEPQTAPQQLADVAATSGLRAGPVSRTTPVVG